MKRRYFATRVHRRLAGRIAEIKRLPCAGAFVSDCPILILACSRLGPAKRLSMVSSRLSVPSTRAFTSFGKDAGASRRLSSPLIGASSFESIRRQYITKYGRWKCGMWGKQLSQPHEACLCPAVPFADGKFMGLHTRPIADRMGRGRYGGYPSFFGSLSRVSCGRVSAPAAYIHRMVAPALLCAMRHGLTKTRKGLCV